MRLHRLGRCCVRRNAGGITSGTVEDMVQSVTSLTSTRERITSLCCEKIVFSPLWDQLLNGNQRSMHQITIWIENVFSCALWDIHPAYLATCKFCSYFEYPHLGFPVAVFMCYLFWLVLSNDFCWRKFLFEVESCQQEVYSKYKHMIAVVVRTTPLVSMYVSLSHWIQVWIPPSTFVL